MNKLYQKLSCPGRRAWIGVTSLLIFMTLGFASRAQEGSQGNTTIFGGAQMTFFGNQNFLVGGSGTQPGVILTERATGAMGYLNFSGNGLTTTGANDANYVDGYVRKYGTGQFIFPVGDNANLGPFAASADGTSGAYFRADPNVAETSNLFTGGNYTALPSGGPFSTAIKAASVGTVSTVEYWDIDGANATPVTLTWDAGSNISTLTGSNLTKLSIAGWSVANSRWEIIPAIVDAASVLGGASTLTAGSITSSASIVPNSYLAYTFAAAAGIPDLTPGQVFSDTQLSIGETVDYVVAISNVGSGPTTLPFVFRVTNFSTSSGLVITQNPASAVIIEGDVYTLSNADFDVVPSSTRFTFTSKTIPAVSLPSSGIKYIGFKITRTGGGIGSTNNTVTIDNGTGGGETPTNNNSIANPITKN